MLNLERCCFSGIEDLHQIFLNQSKAFRHILEIRKTKPNSSLFRLLTVILFFLLYAILLHYCCASGVLVIVQRILDSIEAYNLDILMKGFV